MSLRPLSGPRRRYLSNLHIELTCQRKRSMLVHPSVMLRGIHAYRTGQFSTCVTRLFQILNSWVCQEVTDNLFTVVLDVHPARGCIFDLHGDFSNLPVVSLIGELHINTKPYYARIMSRAWLDLLRKLPQLKTVALGISPWCSSEDGTYSPEIRGKVFPPKLSCNGKNAAKHLNSTL